MATLISSATGNFTASGTWKTADTTSLLDSETANTALTTSAVASSTFTPGAITIDGIAVKLASVAGTTGTITITLDKAGTSIATVTQNISTLPTCTTATGEGGWVLFQFSAVTLLAATAYSIKASVSSGASAVNLYTDSTANNWSRLLRQSTNVGAAAPTTGDAVYVIGQLTGTAGTTSYTVTMDSVSTNQLGCVSICDYATLSYGTSASTAYYLKTIGNQASTPGVIIYSGGTLQMGTLSTPIPSTSSAVLELNAGSDGQYGLTIKNGATLTTYGATVATVNTTLSANVAANAASFTTTATTGWVVGDVVAIASTTQTATDTEQITVSSTSGTTVNVSVGGGTGGNTVKNAHSGTSPTQAEVIHLTRNVKIRNASASFGAYVNPRQTSTVSCTYTEFYNLGSTVANQRGVDVAVTTGSFTLDHCSIHDTRNWGLYLATASGGQTLTSLVCYNLNTVNAASTASIFVTQTTGTHTVNGLYILAGNATSNGVLEIQDDGSSYTTVTVAGSTSTSSGINSNETPASSMVMGTFSGITVHSCSGTGFRMGGTNKNGTVSSLTVWRNGGVGLLGNIAQQGRILFSSLSAFGNTTSNVQFGNAGVYVLASPSIQGDATFAVATGITQGNGLLIVQNGSIGTTQAHSTQDLIVSNGSMGQVQLYNTTMSSSTPIGSASSMAETSWVRSHKDGGSSTTHKATYRRGTISANQTTRHTASGYSWQLAPSSSTNTLLLPGPTEFDTFKIPVVANTTVTLSCWMQKDASYNGTSPTIVIVGGVIAGVGSAGTDSTTTATLTSTGTWYQISCAPVQPSEDGAIEFYITCTGTAGNLYIDDVGLS